MNMGACRRVLASPEGVIVLVAYAAEELLPLRHLLQRPHPGCVQQVTVLVQDIRLQLLVTVIIIITIISIIMIITSLPSSGLVSAEYLTRNRQRITADTVATASTNTCFQASIIAVNVQEIWHPNLSLS